MYWGTLLHFYQPYGQKREIIDAIVAQCYRPVVEDILSHQGARISVNFTGVLLDQLDAYGHRDIIDLYAEAAKLGRIEFVGSGKYHAILPLLPPSEAERQIELNTETGRKYFGDAFAPRGIFLPEMAWSPELTPILERAGFEWVMLDELAYNGRPGQVDYTRKYQIRDSKLFVMFREHRLSAAIMNVVPRELGGLKEAAREELGAKRYIVTGMDGETFGHHRVGHTRILAAMYDDPGIQLVRMSEILTKFDDTEVVETLACTWASSQDDIEKGIQFISWDDPTNNIHKLQWELLRLTVKEMNGLSRRNPIYARLRAQLDSAVSSDQFFWAAARPWWMVEYIERGAHDLLQVLTELPNSTPKIAAQGLAMYQQIMATAWEWQRTGKIDTIHEDRAKRVRIPFKEATLVKGDTATWAAFMELLEAEELSASSRRDYEEARLWRDAIYKLEHKLDIYDLHYVLDILHHKLPKGAVEDAIARHRAEFDKIRGGQVEQRSN